MNPGYLSVLKFNFVQYVILFIFLVEFPILYHLFRNEDAITCPK